MRFLVGLAVFFSSIAFTTVFSNDALAAYSPVGKCRKAVRSWRRSPGYGAFAVSRRGSACGYSSGYPTRKRANRAALRKCRRLARRCRIISTTKASARRRAAGRRLRGDCRRNFNEWSKRDSFGAFALARDGTYCYAVWDAASIKQASELALKNCKAKSGCTVYRTIQPRDLKKLHQRQLQELGFYKGKIDGSWGRGSKGAMRRFVKLAGHDRPDDDTAYALLKWAIQVQRGYTVSAQEAAGFAKRAMREGSIDFVAALAKARTGSGNTPSSGADTAPTEPEAPIVADLGRKLGLFAPEKWPLGKGVWQFSSTDRQHPDARLSGRCRLSSGGIVFAHYADPKIGTVAFFHQLKFDRGERSADWVFQDNSNFKADIKNIPGIGPAMVVPKPGNFFEALKEDTLVSVRSAQQPATFATTNIDRFADAFTDCLRKVVLEPTAKPTPKLSKKNNSDEGVATARRNGRGQFIFLAELNALPVFMLFDTGATWVTIPESVARKLGIKLKPADFKHEASTANGIAKYAKARIKEMRVGSIVYKNIEAAVLKDKALNGMALLGMTFLQKLKRFEYEGDKVKLIR